MDELDFDLNFEIGEDSQEPPAQPSEKKGKKEPKPDQGPIRIKHRKGLRQLTRKASSELALETAMNWHWQEGDSYHCFSFGDVDSFSFFKMVLRQQRIEYAALSTWCMAGEDVQDLIDWHKRGMIGRVDFYLGEIFAGSYPEVYEMVTKKALPLWNGRLVIFRNHSKVMAIKGERFDCLIESSANINTNPRSENTVVTVDRELVDYYVRLFGEIKPFNKDPGAPPYEV